MDERLTKVIDELLEEGTFNAKAVEGISNLREKVETLETQNGALKRTDEEQKRKLRYIEGQIAAWEKQAGDANEREQKVKEREATIHEVDIRMARADAASETFKECFGLVFRNTTVRKDMYGMTPVVVGQPGYPNQEPTSETVTETPE